MEFNEKLQELRKKRGLTQEELASKLYVSRTAISKWESGRGYPSIESLRMISEFFSVSIDDLLSSNEVLNIAEENNHKSEKHLTGLVFGLLDLSMLLLLFLPLFAQRVGEAITPSSLISLDGVQPYIKVSYFILVISTSLFGAVTLALQGFCATLWLKLKGIISLSLGILTVILFMITLQPYASVFTFALLLIKVLLYLIKRV